MPKKLIPAHDEPSIVELHVSGYNQKSIAHVFNCTRKCIHRVLKKYGYVNGLLKGEKNANSVLTEKEVLEMREIYDATDLGFYQIAKEYNIHKSTARRAILGITWKHI